MYIENKLNVVTSIFNVSVVCLLNVLFWSPNENKLTHCGLFVRASVKEIKREIFLSRYFNRLRHVGLFGFESCQIIGIFVRLECGRRRFDVSCLGIVGLHMRDHVRSFEKLIT